MKVLMHSEEALTVSEVDRPGMEIGTAPGVHAHFSAFEMFATSIGLCTASLLVSYGESLGVEADELAIRLDWQLAEQPRRIGKLEMQIHWPQLPESRLEAAERVAGQCPLHTTLKQPPELSTRLIREAAPVRSSPGEAPVAESDEPRDHHTHEHDHHPSIH